MPQNLPRVLMFGWEFPPFNSGGLGVACLGLTRSLTSQGAHIIFVLPKNLGAKAEFMEMKFADSFDYPGCDKMTIKELEVFLYPYLNEIEYKSKEDLIRMFKEKGIIPCAGNLFEEVMRYAKLSRGIIRNEQYDLIHVHDWLSFPAGMEAKKISKKKLIVHVHATEFDRTGGNINPKIYNIEKMGLEAADKVVTVSQATGQIVNEKYGISQKKIEVVHNGIDESYFKKLSEEKNKFEQIKRNGSKIVLFLGRITIQKGPDYFIKTAKRVLEYEPDTYFLVAGSGDMERSMIRQAAGYGIASRVLFIGWLRGSDIDRLYQAADIFVMPSISEPFGITALEAMANGTPALVSKQSGVVEAAANVLKVDFWDTEEMANKIISVLAYNELHRHLAENGREEAKTISWNKAAEKCINIYNSMICQPI